MGFEKNILVVEDNIANRKILVKILSDDYNVFEAENGQEALELLNSLPRDVDLAAIVLDLVMPNMNGYDLMEKITNSNRYKDTPLIVTTVYTDKEAEIKALSCGAWEYLQKPYDKDILKFRINKAIESSNQSVLQRLKYMTDFDSLTGIYNKRCFFEETSEMLDNNRDKKFVFIRFDIDRFRLINSFFGVNEGDAVLTYVAKKLSQYMKNYTKCKYGRIEADVFAVCHSYDDKLDFDKMAHSIKADLLSFNPNYDMVPNFGVYYIEDHDEPLDLILDKATLAAEQTKGNYLTLYSVYDKKMSEKIDREQRITNEMSIAFEENRFFIHLQPKYDILKNRPVGAEALVRWNSPKLGLISPGEFIPIFEKNGFITKLDCFVWEKVCKLLRAWIDQGKLVYPISVNISRVNMYNPNIADIIFGITQKYNVPTELLNLELTETAYADNPEAMVENIAKLQARGFVILMDDFGSGYSALNVLKDIAVDILKLDMKFLSNTKITGRGENIIASVVRMSKWLKIPVVAEGVETKSQLDFLRSIGCEYVQGYYFAKPMPVDEYENLMSSENAFIDIRDANDDNFDTDNLWASNPQMELLFSDVLQASGIYEYRDGNVEALRINNAYYQLLGCDDEVIKSDNLLRLIDYTDRQTVIDCFENAVKTQSVGECEYLRHLSDGKALWLHIKLKYINKIGDRHILFGALSDITSQKEINTEIMQYRSAIHSNIGVNRCLLIVDDVEVNRVILREFFYEEYRVLEASNGQEALELLKEHDVDAILLDLMMPVMDGKVFLQQKREIAKIASVPVVIISVDASEQQQVKTLALGANDYIVKPFVREVVVKRVNNVIESSQRVADVLREYSDIISNAQSDELTGVYTRKAGYEIIEKTIMLQPTLEHAMLVIRICDFNVIVQEKGKEFADTVLKLLSEHLKGYFRKTDIIARTQEDEFVVFMPGVGDKNDVKEKCTGLCEQLLAVEMNAEKLELNCHIGVSFFPKDGKILTELYEKTSGAIVLQKNSKSANCLFLNA